MKNSSANHLCCPCCKKALSAVDQIQGSNFNSNVLKCLYCNRDYTVTNGIVNFIKTDEMPKFSRRMNMMRGIYARFYTPATRIMFLPCGGEKKARNEVLSQLEINAGASILETGIGCGDNMPYLKSRFGNGQYCGVDIQKRMILACKSNLAKWNLEAELHVANAEELPFRDNVFDVVFHLGAFNLFRKKKQALDEMIRVAKPGTRIVIADETEKASKLFGIFLGKQEPVILPGDIVPPSMQEKRLDIIWNSYGYLLTFRKPA